VLNKNISGYNQKSCLCKNLEKSGKTNIRRDIIKIKENVTAVFGSKIGK